MTRWWWFRTILATLFIQVVNLAVLSRPYNAVQRYAKQFSEKRPESQGVLFLTEDAQLTAYSDNSMLWTRSLDLSLTSSENFSATNIDDCLFIPAPGGMAMYMHQNSSMILNLKAEQFLGRTPWQGPCDCVFDVTRRSNKFFIDLKTGKDPEYDFTDVETRHQIMSQNMYQLTCQETSNLLERWSISTSDLLPVLPAGSQPSTTIANLFDFPRAYVAEGGNVSIYQSASTFQSFKLTSTVVSAFSLIPDSSMKLSINSIPISMVVPSSSPSSSIKIFDNNYEIPSSSFVHLVDNHVYYYGPSSPSYITPINIVTDISGHHLMTKVDQVIHRPGLETIIDHVNYTYANSQKEDFMCFVDGDCRMMMTQIYASNDNDYDDWDYKTIAIIILSVLLVLITAYIMFRGPKHLISIDYNALLGRGSFSHVYQGVYDGSKVAVKRIEILDRNMAMKEIKILKASDCNDNIIRYLFKEVRLDGVYLALELCDMTLKKAIESIDRSRVLMANDDERVKKFVFDIGVGLNHLHRHGIIHRDIKPSNILLKRKDSYGAISPIESLSDLIQFTPKISDFGLSRNLDADLTPRSNHHNHGEESAYIIGTFGWQPQEVLCKSSSSSSNELSDVFSLGCVYCFILSCGNHPFGDPDDRISNITSNRISTTVMESLPACGSRLIFDMIQHDPTNRISMPSVISHYYFWNIKGIFEFLNNFSAVLEDEIKLNTSSLRLTQLESNFQSVCGLNDWKVELKLDELFKIEKRRSYDGTKLRDLIRFVRNKHQHFTEDAVVVARFGDVNGFWTELRRLFPMLLQVCCEFQRGYTASDEETETRGIGIAVPVDVVIDSPVISKNSPSVSSSTTSVSSPSVAVSSPAKTGTWKKKTSSSSVLSDTKMPSSSSVLSDTKMPSSSSYSDMKTVEPEAFVMPNDSFLVISETTSSNHWQSRDWPTSRLRHDVPKSLMLKGRKDSYRRSLCKSCMSGEPCSFASSKKGCGFAHGLVELKRDKDLAKEGFYMDENVVLDARNYMGKKEL